VWYNRLTINWLPKFLTCGRFPWEAPTHENDDDRIVLYIVTQSVLLRLNFTPIEPRRTRYESLNGNRSVLHLREAWRESSRGHPLFSLRPSFLWQRFLSILLHIRIRFDVYIRVYVHPNTCNLYFVLIEYR
jgi:hypothetical protein